jgi:hypothetical protein
MEVITVNVGQNALSIIRHNHEAIIWIAAFLPAPMTPSRSRMFATALKDVRDSTGCQNPEVLGFGRSNV